ncbi:YeeE/YedE family protein [Cognatishimia sp. MH4019]|uniref:YeeE/YedE family protein n=1 Tax=Cognatishimia sp. MH4019 TaxID=2854030 RepID=UPI001CD74062|nr:YeeE/YedE family protein [Cognatishimia sp. MH4019]
MFADLNLGDMTPLTASILLGAVLGLLFGALGQRSRFCIRRGLVSESTDRRQAFGTWIMALATALLGTQAAVAAGLISFAGHRFMADSLPLASIALGGLVFGAGMVLTRGCISRQTVLLGTGNTRSLIVIAAFALVAHATLKGVLAPVRTGVGSLTVDRGITSFAGLPGGAALWTAVLAIAAFGIAARSGAKWQHLAMGGAIGLLIPAGWVGTGFVLFDDFDPIAMQSLSFTLPWADTLFWTIASSAIPAGFGVGLTAGVIGGSLIAALVAREFAWQGFETPRQTGRYLLGASLMGFGGVLAGGCTVGAGLSGTATLSFAAALVLVFVIVGALLADRVLTGAQGAVAVPAE